MADVEKIKRWQRDFYQGVFEPSEAYVSKACEDIQQTVALTSEDRLAIYRNSILGGITSGLMGIYPVCNRLVGDTFFTHMVSGYLIQYPSKSPDVGEYGAFLADYLDHFLIKIKQQDDLNYLPDVARLEWLWHQAFNAPEVMAEQAVIPLSELAAVNPNDQGDIQFQLQPSLGLLASIFPIDDIWQANQAAGIDEEARIELNGEYKEFVIWRSADFAMHIERVSIAGGLEFLADIQQGLSFADIAAKEYASPVAELLPYFLQSGLIIGFTLEDESFK